MEKKKLYVNTKASRMVKTLRVISWILAIVGIIIGLILIGADEEEIMVPALVAGIAFFFIALFLKPAYVRTLAAEITIAMAKEDYELYSDPDLTKKLEA